jgi:hypothetical protein
MIQRAVDNHNYIWWLPSVNGEGKTTFNLPYPLPLPIPLLSPHINTSFLTPAFKNLAVRSHTGGCG